MTNHLTLFTAPKAFDGITDINQRRAIKSWAEIPGVGEIFLLGKEAGIAEFTTYLRATYPTVLIKHIPDIEVSPRGVPCIPSLFKTAIDASSNDWICYANSDVVLMKDIRFALLWLDKPVLVFGSHYDIPLDYQSHLNSLIERTWNEEDLRNRVAQIGGKIHTHGLDYFIFHKSMFQNLKPFILGRGTWDNYLLYYAKRVDKAPLIDATKVITCLHQEHGYKSDLVMTPVGYYKGPEAIYNYRLTEDYDEVMTIHDADLVGDLTASSYPILYLRRSRLRFIKPVIELKKWIMWHIRMHMLQ